MTERKRKAGKRKEEEKIAKRLEREVDELGRMKGELTPTQRLELSGES